jgi:hypothetical protein
MLESKHKKTFRNTKIRELIKEFSMPLVASCHCPAPSSHHSPPHKNKTKKHNINP